MPLVNLHYVFHCKSCHAPLVLHAEKLGQQFMPRGNRPIGTRCVGVACPQCKEIRCYSNDKRHWQYDPTWRLVYRHPIVETEVLAAALHCADSFCVPLTRLVSPARPGMSKEERAAEIASWNWDGFFCNAGHQIPRLKTIQKILC